MDTLPRFGCFTSSITKSPLHRPPSSTPRPWKPPVFTATQQTSLRPVSEITEDHVLETFLRDRQLNGDFISRLSDTFWQRQALQSLHSQPSLSHTSQPRVQVVEDGDDDDDDEGGFLKLSRAQEWLLSDNSAPRSRKAIAKALEDDRERRKRLNLLKYEAIKREFLLVSIGIGTACTGYCLIALSLQAALSYATGVVFSCLYLQLLYKHVDNLSREKVPQIFRQKKTKKTGIKGKDLQDLFVRTIKGSGIALSSPRLVIPAAIYGLWILCHQYFTGELFDFQIVPAMLGMFVYKGAALVQVYRDNEDLQFVSPEEEASE